MDLLIRIFLFLVNHSFSVLFLTAVVFAVRLLFRRLPRRYLCVLWLLVFIKLIAPGDSTSVIGFSPVGETTLHYQADTGRVMLETGFNRLDDRINHMMNENAGISSDSLTDTYGASDWTAVEAQQKGEYFPIGGTQENGNTASDNAAVRSDADGWTAGKKLFSWLSVIWAAGVWILIGYSIVRIIRMKRLTATAVRTEEYRRVTLPDGRLRTRLGRRSFRVYVSDRIVSPYLFGFFRPVIYLPLSLQQKDQGFVILHEQLHILRKDHIIKPVLFLITCMYWFHPLVWLSFFLFSRDVESAVDEAVCRAAKQDVRADYADALLKLSMKQSGLYLPLAFGESHTKERIRHVLCWERGGKRLTAAAAAVLAAALLCFFCGPSAHSPVVKEDTEQADMDEDSESAGSLLAFAKQADVVHEGRQQAAGGERQGTDSEDEEGQQAADGERQGTDSEDEGEQQATGEEEQETGEDLFLMVYNIARSARVLDRYENITDTSPDMEFLYMPDASASDEIAMTENCRYYKAQEPGSSPEEQEISFDAAADYIDKYSELGVQCRAVTEKGLVTELHILEDESILDGIELQTPIVLYEDVTGDGISDRIKIDPTYLNMPRTGLEQTVTIMNGSTGMMFYMHTSGIHPDWAGYYLYRDKEGDTYLLYFNPQMYQGCGDYRYRLFLLSDEVGMVTYRFNQISFDLNDPDSVDTEALHAFCDEIEGYLSQSIVLIDTNEQRMIYSTPDDPKTVSYKEQFDHMFGGAGIGW